VNACVSLTRTPRTMPGFASVQRDALNREARNGRPREARSEGETLWESLRFCIASHAQRRGVVRSQKLRPVIQHPLRSACATKSTFAYWASFCVDRLLRLLCRAVHWRTCTFATPFSRRNKRECHRRNRTIFVESNSRCDSSD
jgi:hypothetical protein